MDISEFRRKNIVHRRGKMKVTNSWGVYDAYKHIRKNGWYDIGRALKEGEFYAIIRGVNKLLAEEVGKGVTINFPCRMGKLELRKYNVGVSIIDGKLRNTYPIDWKETWELWFKDNEAFQKKILLRDEQDEVYHVKYIKHTAAYQNKTFYLFVLNNKIKRTLKENIQSGKIDTLW